MHRWHNWRNGTSRIKKKAGFEKFDVKVGASVFSSLLERVLRHSETLLISFMKRLTRHCKRETSTLFTRISPSTHMLYVESLSVHQNGSVFAEDVARRLRG